MQLCTPTSKKNLKKSNQKWVKCWMKAPIRQVLLHTSLFLVQFSKIYFRILYELFLIRNQLQTDACVAFVNSLSIVPPISSLNTAASHSLSQQKFWPILEDWRSRESRGYLLYRIPEWQFLIIFCYIQSCYSQGTLNLTKDSFLLEWAVIN